MKVLNVRNVHEALPVALKHLYEFGEERPSRNGPVLQTPYPVATVYEKPCERVIYWPERDANPFFHVYEMLWMIAGRDDLAGPQRYVKSFGAFSDDGLTLHGAYGKRWRKSFGIDQLAIIAKDLIDNPESRRCVLQMWSSAIDLGVNGKDLPCNDTATFQIGKDEKLHLVMFCRSNDIVWGAYGANAVHFSFLLEYMAEWLGREVGTYTQISVNWHGYLKTLGSVKPLADLDVFVNPYVSQLVRPIGLRGGVELMDEKIQRLLNYADTGTIEFANKPGVYNWESELFLVLKAHHLFNNKTDPDRFKKSFDVLREGNQDWQWIKAAEMWLKKRAIGADQKQS